MTPLNLETNVNVLREYALLATRETTRPQGVVEDLNRIMSEMSQSWLKDDRSQINLEDQLHRLQKKFFGFGRETLKGKEARAVGSSNTQLKLHGERVQDEKEYGLTKEQGKAVALDAHKAVIEHAMSDDEVKNEISSREPETSKSVGAEAWEEMKGFTEDSVEITVTEVVYQKVIHRRHKYRLKDKYNRSGKEVIITAKGPAKLKAGCTYSIDFALAVVSDKYEFHLPLERQRRKMDAANLEIDVKTLYTLCASTAEHMTEVAERIKSEITNDFCAVHLDESGWLIIGEKHKGQMWALSNRRGSCYRFEPTRSGKVASELLEGFTGSMITDAFPGYNRLKSNPGVRRGLCWAHVRRDFYERIDDFPIAKEMVHLIDDLFEIEAQAKTFEALRLLRREKSRAKIKEIEAWILHETPNYLPGDGLRKAINYAANHWQGLTEFLRDLSIPLSNNDAERALRHVVLGRKNFAGSRTINGADVAATLYTIIESAKKVGLQPKIYMKYVIEERWHNRVPKTPAEYSLEKFGPNKRVVFPDKNDWRI